MNYYFIMIPPRPSVVLRKSQAIKKTQRDSVKNTSERQGFLKSPGTFLSDSKVTKYIAYSCTKSQAKFVYTKNKHDKIKHRMSLILWDFLVNV